MHCEGFRGIQLPPAWGFDDSPTSSPVGAAPTQGAAPPQPLQSAFSKDNPLEGCPTSCQSNGQFSFVPRALQRMPAATAGAGVGEGGCWHRCLGPCQRGILRIMGVSHAFAAAALCRVEFLPPLPKAPVPGFYTTQGFLALAVEGRKHEELMT